MVAVGDIAQFAGRLRDEGFLELADALAYAHVGMFSSTELAMKWRFLLGRTLGAELSRDTREQAQSLRQQLDAALA